MKVSLSLISLSILHGRLGINMLLKIGSNMVSGLDPTTVAIQWTPSESLKKIN